MKLGLRKACVPFCRSLAEQGVMSLKHLPKDCLVGDVGAGVCPSRYYDSARTILGKTGMQQVQIDRVVENWVGTDETEGLSVFD